jgi:hypothetical protein
MCVTSLGRRYGNVCDNVSDSCGNVCDIFMKYLRKVFLTSLGRNCLIVCDIHRALLRYL